MGSRYLIEAHDVRGIEARKRFHFGLEELIMEGSFEASFVDHFDGNCFSSIVVTASIYYAAEAFSDRIGERIAKVFDNLARICRSLLCGLRVIVLRIEDEHFLIFNTHISQRIILI